MTRTLGDAQHEAAHVVVGVALGLRLRRAALGKDAAVVRGVETLGYALFSVSQRKSTAWAITLAAGIAYERRAGDEETAAGDRKLLRKEGHSAHAIAALVVSADAILETRWLAHARVTRALLQRDLTGADIEAIAKGERVDAE